MSNDRFQLSVITDGADRLTCSSRYVKRDPQRRTSRLERNIFINKNISSVNQTYDHLCWGTYTHYYTRVVVRVLHSSRIKYIVKENEITQLCNWHLEKRRVCNINQIQWSSSDCCQLDVLLKSRIEDLCRLFFIKKSVKSALHKKVLIILR